MSNFEEFDKQLKAVGVILQASETIFRNQIKEFLERMEEASRQANLAMYEKSLQVSNIITEQNKKNMAVVFDALDFGRQPSMQEAMQMIGNKPSDEWQKEMEEFLEKVNSEKMKLSIQHQQNKRGKKGKTVKNWQHNKYWQGRK
jgi:hypothetical protein